MVAECHVPRSSGRCASPATVLRRFGEPVPAEDPIVRQTRVRPVSSTREWPEKWTLAHARKAAWEAVERIVKDGKDAGEVVRRVRALFKQTAIERVRLDLAEVIGEVLRLLDSYPARKHVSLDVVLAPDLPPVFADRVQLQQLVLNLMINALEALEPVSGRVKQLSVRSTRAEGPQAVIRITDNGIGLDDSVAAFEPFITTKPEGMGLGLAICRSIVAAHDGTLSAECNVGFGTTFTVTLPIQPDGTP
jgi:signal transduction histidine kinase